MSDEIVGGCNDLAGVCSCPTDLPEGQRTYTVAEFFENMNAKWEDVV